MRRKFKRLPLPELAIGSTEFRLVGQAGADPDRLERERIQRDQDKRSGQEFTALANANVLAASPQMLEALEMVLADRMVFKSTITRDAVVQAIADATKPVEKDQTSKIRRKPVDTVNERR